MKSAALIKELEKHAVFTSRIVQGMLKNESSYTDLFIHRLKKAGTVHEIEKGKYTVHNDPFLVSSRIIWPSYISFWSALRYHNLTEQVPHSIWVVTTKQRRKKRLVFMGTEINFIMTKPKYLFGYEKADYGGFEIFIAEPEKTIIDCLIFRKVSVSELFSVLKTNMNRLHPRKLMGYSIRTGNKAVTKRLGYMLNELDCDYYEKVGNHIYYPITKLEQNLPAKGEIDDKWKIQVNVEL